MAYRVGLPRRSFLALATNLGCSSRANLEVSFRMSYSHCSGSHKLPSSRLIQLSQASHAYTPGESSESYSEDQLLPFMHFTNEVLVSYKPEANLAIGNNQNPNKLWRPLTLQTPTLIDSLLTTGALIALIEYMNKISVEEKALFFAEGTKEFAVGMVLCYRHLHQMIIVPLGVGWAAVDLYMKRLELYFQLSKPEGATVRNSIFLHYTFGLIACVPINTARKGCVLVHIRLVRDFLIDGVQALESLLI